MSHMDKDERQVLSELASAVNALKTTLTQPKIGNSANISINAGGFGLWAAMTACLVMLAVNVLLVVILINHNRKIDDLNDYLTAIYMMAPHLKPPEKK